MNYADAALFHVTGPQILPPPRGSVKSGQYLNGFKHLVQQLGGDWLHILRENQISAALVEDSDKSLDWERAAALLEYCSRSLNDNLFGLRLASLQGAEVYGCVAALARSAPTLRQGLQCIIDFLPFLHSPGAEIELVTGRSMAELRWFPHPDFSSHEQAADHGLMQSVRLLGAVGGDDFRPSYAVSASKRRRNRETIEDRLKCRVHWEADMDGIGFPSELLDRPLRSSNPIPFALLASYLLQLKKTQGPSLVEQVQFYIEGALRSRSCSIGECAARLDMSARTLQKRLTAAGVSFSEMVEEQRVNTAKRVLVETPWPLERIAVHLGYSEKSSFSRAFKKSTRLTPMAYRAQRYRSRG